MRPGSAPEGETLIREFFGIVPDYSLCRTLTDNIKENQTTYPEALRQLALKAEASRENSEQIVGRLNHRSVLMGEEKVRIKDLRLRQMAGLGDDALREVLVFYFKHPYAHSRCKKWKVLPSWIRSFALRYLIAQARARGLKMEYSDIFELLRLL